jgi:type I restriction enzyme R subunit
LRDDYGKYFFNILDFTQSTRLFADPGFDGDPTVVTEQGIDDEGNPTGNETEVKTGETIPEDEEGEPEGDEIGGDTSGPGEGGGGEKRQKYYVDGGQVEIAADLVYELDPNGKQLRVVKYTDYTASKVRNLFPNAADLRKKWADPGCRNEIIEALADRGIEFEELASASKQPDADPFDLLCHVAFNGPLRTRRERADRLKTERKDFFEKYAPEARRILEELLEKYTEHGTAQFVIPEILEVPPLSEHGNVIEIASSFGGVDQLREAIAELQTLLYAAA